MRYFGTLFAFILFIIAMKFFNDGNMYWWPFMFAFVVTSGFLVGEDDDEIIEHCDECGYINQACVCKPVVNVPLPTDIHDNLAKSLNKYASDWEEYKATYDDAEYDDSVWVKQAMSNRDAEIKHKTDDDIPF